MRLSFHGLFILDRVVMLILLEIILYNIEFLKET